MKKLIALILGLMLMTGVALAGTASLEVQKLTDDEYLVVLLDEGVKEVNITDVYDMKLITFDLVDETMPQYVMVVSYSEILDGLNLSDLEESELQTLADLTAADSFSHEYKIVEMADGWPAVLVLYEGEDDWVDAFTVISGYFIQVHGAHSDFSALTEAEENYAFTLLDSVDVVPVTE